MTKEEVASAITSEFKAMIQWYESQPNDKFKSGPDQKWTADQHLDHLIRSAAPVNMALRLPKVVLKLKFGTANRDSGDYDAVVAKYQDKLGQGGAASGQFLPKETAVENKQKKLDALKHEGERLAAITRKWSESNLDKYILPHPLIGRMTIREMLLFTIYHIRHHHKTLTENYE